MRTTTRRLLSFRLFRLVVALNALYFNSCVQLLAQCTSVTELQFVNPSFEGPLGAHITPAPWNTCNITPDTQPNSWGITLPPSHGSSYVGFVYGGPGWQEGVSQQMNGTFIAGTTYTFTIDLASTNSNQGGISPGPAMLVIHGSNTLCGRDQLLWTSPMVSHTNWQTYTVTFVPDQNYPFVYFSIAPQSGMNRYIMLDNITPISPVTPFVSITSHTNNSTEGCSFDISGTISDDLADSIIVEGNFEESPVHATVNGTNWSAHITPTGSPVYIYSTLYYLDPVLNVQTCSYDSVRINVSMPTLNFTTNNVCEGTAATFTNTSIPLNNIPILSYDWDFGDGTTSTETSPSHTYTAAGTYTVTLTALDASGCTTSREGSITIHPNPEAAFTTDNTCLGTPTPLLNSSTISSGTITGYAWDINQDNITDYSTENAQHTYVAPGTQTIRLTVTSDNGCTHSTSLETQVYPNPSISIAPSDNCERDTSIVINTSQIEIGNYTTAWDIDANGTTEYNTQNLVHVFPVPGTYPVRLIVTSDFGCTDSSDFNIVVHARPTASFTSDPHCLGLPSFFTNTSTINPVDNNQISFYEWDFGNGQNTTGASPTHQYTSANTYPVRMIAISNHGCRDTVIQNHQVYAKPSPTFTATNVCLENITTFSNGTQIDPQDNGPYTYLWKFNDGEESTSVSTTHTYQYHGAYSVTLVATTENGCKDSVQQLVHVYPLPEVLFSATDLESCSPLCTSLYSQSTVASPSTIQYWDWTIDGAPISNDELNLCLENDTHDPIKRTICLTITTNHGCTANLIKPDFLTVHDLPIAAFNLGNPEISIVNTAVDFENESINADSYLWQFGNMGVTTESNPQYNFPNNEEGRYRIILTARTAYGCQDTVSHVLRVREEFIFYVPNTFTPDNDIHNQVFRPILDAGYDQFDYTLIIYNRWGEMVFESHDDSIGWDGTYNNEQSPNGVYIWQLEIAARVNEERKIYNGHVNLLR